MRWISCLLLIKEKPKCCFIHLCPPTIKLFLPDGLVVRIWYSRCCSPGSIPCQGMWFLHCDGPATSPECLSVFLPQHDSIPYPNPPQWPWKGITAEIGRMFPWKRNNIKQAGSPSFCGATQSLNRIRSQEASTSKTIADTYWRLNTGSTLLQLIRKSPHIFLNTSRQWSTLSRSCIGRKSCAPLLCCSV